MREKPIITESAREIICSELKLPFVHSVILIGSRARGDGYASSDYDLYIVVPISALPFVFPVLKKREKTLKEKLKAEVSISPLTYSRMKRGRDTLIFHTKKEGVILCGENIRPKIKVDSVSELPPDELFQYFFDSLFYLIKPFNLDGNINQEELIRNCAKSIIYCANLRLMLRGVYSGSWEDVMRLSSDPLVKKAYKVIKRQSKIKNALCFWFLAKEYAIKTFQDLIKSKYSLEEFSKWYLSSHKMSFLRKIQMLFLSLFHINTTSPFFIYSLLRRGIPPDRYFHVMLLFVVESLHFMLKTRGWDFERMYAIRKVTKTNNYEDIYTTWKKKKEMVEKYWQIVCGKSVI